MFTIIAFGIHTIQVAVAAQLICWTGQFLGHGIFEVSNFLRFEDEVLFSPPLSYSSRQFTFLVEKGTSSFG